MQLCYVDESGKAEVLTDDDKEQQPVVVIAGVVLPEAHLLRITNDWIDLKARFHPAIQRVANRGRLDAILHDVKGTTTRKGFRDTATRRKRQNAIGMVDGTLSLLETYSATIVGRVWVKALDDENNAMAMHQSSLQFICAAFHSVIPSGERGMVVVDSQTYWHNKQLAHSVFTQRFAKKPRHLKLADMPVFGHSDNHAGLQIADFLCSAVLAPIACTVYASRYEAWNVHCDPGYLEIRDRFGERLEKLTFQWQNPRTQSRSSSLVVQDPLGKRSSRLMWGPNSNPHIKERGGPKSPKSPRPKRGRRRRRPEAS